MSPDKTTALPVVQRFSAEHYKETKRREILRLLLTYVAPVLLLSIYFYYLYDSIVVEGRRLHLIAIAESQANTLDLFLSERIVNLANLIDDPQLEIPPSKAAMEQYLVKLRRNSDAFADIGYFDSTGLQTGYAGPFPSLERRNYRQEPWFISLKEGDQQFIITDVYLGFRQRPHFTIAVSRIIDSQYVVVRATLDPERIYEYVRTLEGAGEVHTSIVNRDGYYQLVTPDLGNPLEPANIDVPHTPRRASGKADVAGESRAFAYSWLHSADWALLVNWHGDKSGGWSSGYSLRIILISVVMILVGMFIVKFRAQKLVEMRMEADQNRAQLEHAAKLASVGELAAGIAHEINNPLAAINEEAGLVKDLLNPEFSQSANAEDLMDHLDSIRDSVFRCRDITQKLLGFVRKTDIELLRHNVHDLIDGVVDGLLGVEMSVSNIEVEKHYALDLPTIMTDGNQLQQVILNLLTNATDAIEGEPGEITITTTRQGNNLLISVADTGKGMDHEQIEKVFMPFYTTKEVGKGTGLGLSVSYGLIKSLGGTIEVRSKPGKGSTFAVKLPIR